MKEKSLEEKRTRLTANGKPPARMANIIAGPGDGDQTALTIGPSATCKLDLCNRQT
ncbi:hypothetical protein K227x_42200 [Rubripirellula lacrimiformis]|uniref:Uncharacterized protein n=1 Tax=Rubripirellula lacrimiformis TaxID=1930273 RepID=A0A517NFD2_9BACT|nr:hypothetical protein K227x_42200 [Rubripirellula lacrimiformis]